MILQASILVSCPTEDPILTTSAEPEPSTGGNHLFAVYPFAFSVSDVATLLGPRGPGRVLRSRVSHSVGGGSRGRLSARKHVSLGVLPITGEKCVGAASAKR